MKYKLILFFVVLTSFCKAQTCNYCSVDDVKKMFIEEGIKDYTDQLNQFREQTFVYVDKNYIKTWSFKYGRCYLFEVVALNNFGFRSLTKLLNKEFKKINATSWHDEENIIELTKKGGLYKFVFIPNFSLTIQK